MSINIFFMKDLLIVSLYLCYIFVKFLLVLIFIIILRGFEEIIVIVLFGVGGGEEFFFFFRIMKISSIRVRYSNIVIFTSIGMSEDFFFFFVFRNFGYFRCGVFFLMFFCEDNFNYVCVFFSYI